MAIATQHVVVPADRDSASDNMLKGIRNYSGCINKAAKLEAKADYEGAVKVIEAGMKRFKEEEDLLSGYLNSLLSRIGCSERTADMQRK